MDVKDGIGRTFTFGTDSKVNEIEVGKIRGAVQRYFLRFHARTLKMLRSRLEGN
jgi:hypothetical protein